MVKFKKLMVSILLITFMSTSIPFNVLADELSPKESNPQEVYGGDTNTQTTEEESTKLILEENIEKREENVKHFLLEDKTYEAVIYNEPVHYMEEGQWKDIDNTLEETIDEELLMEEAVVEWVEEEVLISQDKEVSTPVTDEITEEEKIVNESSEETLKETEKIDETTKIKDEDNTESQNQSEIEKSEGNTKNIFQNIANGFKLKLAKKADAKKLIRISKDNYEISWGIEGASKVFSEVINTDENKVNELIEKSAEAQVNQNSDLKLKASDVKNEEKQRIIENEKKKTLNKVSSSVIYKNIFQDIDLNYKIVGDVVKENIIINKYSEKNEFVFNLKVKNLMPVKQQDNSIVFYDENDLTKEQFLIAAPFIIDSNNVTSSDIQVKIEEQNGGYKLIYKINEEWLKEPNRKYPVTLDPVVETSLSPTNINDTFISKGNPDQNNGLAHILSVGYGKYSQETRSLVSFNLPTLTAADSVIGAKFSLYLCEPDSYAGQIDIHKVNSSWSSNTVTWNNQPQFNSEIEDYQIMGTYDFYTWDITGIVKNWYVTGNNNGLLVKHRHENQGQLNINNYLSSDTSIEFEAGRPRATIFYINNSGLEGYWNYHSQSVGRAGVSYTNDFNGNVVHIHDDITMTGSRNPISMKHVYNSNNLGWDPSKPWFGRGWNLSIYQWLVRKQIGADWYYEYADGDGTKHYFKDTGEAELKDELNIGYTLIKDSGGYFKYIKDKDDNKIKFYGDAVGSVYSFIDNQGNETITTWEKAANGVWCITALTDATGRKVTLNYDKNAYMTDFVDPSGLKTGYTYDSTYNKLLYINYPDGQVSKFGYYPNSYLYGVTNVDDYSVWFEYTPYEPYRVKKMYEWYNGVYGNEITMLYGNNTTKFTDLKNRSEFYQFDNAGKTVSIKNADDSAQYFKYGDTENITKIGQSSKLQKTILNHLENHDAELNTGWNAYNNLATYTQEHKVLGNKSFKISSPTIQNETYFVQYIPLTKGKTYTFSGEIKTVGVTQGENIGAALTISYKDASGVWQYERVYVNGTKDWARYEKSFTFPIDSAYDKVWIAVELILSSGTAYFDCLQLEEGEVAIDIT